VLQADVLLDDRDAGRGPPGLGRCRHLPSPSEESESSRRVRRFPADTFSDIVTGNLSGPTRSVRVCPPLRRPPVLASRVHAEPQRHTRKPAHLICPFCKVENDELALSCVGCGRALSPLAVGDVLSSRYEILEILGRGGMGTVHKAHDRILDEIVAVKVL